MGDATPRRRFFDLWTLKEAFIKAVGVGLSHQLNRFSFEFIAERRIGFTAPSGYNAAEWQFALYEPSEDTRLAVAVHAPAKSSLRWRAQAMDAVPTRIEPVRTSRG